MQIAKAPAENNSEEIDFIFFSERLNKGREKGYALKKMMCA